MKHWNELTPLEQAHEIYSDMHKDAYGFRPRNDVSAWTLEDFEAEFAIMQKVIKEDMEREAAEQEQAVHDLEMRLQSLMMMGAKSRDMAIGWLHQAYDTNGDDEYLCYFLNIPYGYFKKAA